MEQVKLSDRLKAIAGLISAGSSVADIGTDHGILPVYLAQTGLASCIYASDISASSIKAAYRTASKANVTDAITFHVAPGLDHITPSDVDTVVIAGMGGETIIGILKDAPWLKNRGVSLILQPQSKVDLLARFLYNTGYAIKKTKSVSDRGRQYTIIKATG